MTMMTMMIATIDLDEVDQAREGGGEDLDQEARTEAGVEVEREITSNTRRNTMSSPASLRLDGRASLNRRKFATFKTIEEVRDETIHLHLNLTSSVESKFSTATIELLRQDPAEERRERSTK
jgi:hypothetical protein